MALHTLVLGCLLLGFAAFSRFEMSLTDFGKKSTVFWEKSTVFSAKLALAQKRRCSKRWMAVGSSWCMQVLLSGAGNELPGASSASKYFIRELP